jgi:uncharacterized protein (DUF58 family)
VTQTQADPGGTTPASGPVFPPGRYGKRREGSRRRWPGLLVFALVIAAMVTIAVRLYGQYGTVQISPTVTNLTSVSDSSVTVTIRVQKPQAPAVCTVDAEARDGTVVGTAEVDVPAGTDVTVTHTVATRARPYIAEIPSCRSAS